MKFEGIESLRWGPGKCQLLVTACVASFLTLFARGGADPSGGFCLQTLTIGRPTTIV
jgi:hypothetical protein